MWQTELTAVTIRDLKQNLKKTANKYLTDSALTVLCFNVMQSPLCEGGSSLVRGSSCRPPSSTTELDHLQRNRGKIDF